MITEDYVSFETAKLLKEKGFNRPCNATYDTAVTGGKPKFSEYEVLNFFPFGMKNSDDKFSMVISAPTLQMAMKWLREVHNLFIEPTAGENDGKFWYDFDIIPVNGRNTKWDHYENIPTEEYSTPEEACEAAIKYCLENLI